MPDLPDPPAPEPPAPEPPAPDPPAPALGPAPWEEHSEWWARTFTEGADPEYEEQILPLVGQHLDGCRRVLDIGCGEGQVARLAAGACGACDAGGLVVGIDPSPAQAGRALGRGGGVRVAIGAGEALPFCGEAFDAAVCCLVVEHVADPEALFAEVARVLRPAGRFLLLVNHPMFQGAGSGLVDDHVLGERYWRVGPYLEQGVVVEEVDPGVHIPFAHRPLSGYLNPLADVGLLLTRMEEPAPLPQFLTGSVAPEVESLVPRLMLLRLERREERPEAGGRHPTDRHCE